MSHAFSMVISNLVDFSMLHGHHRDVAGYAIDSAALLFVDLESKIAVGGAAHDGLCAGQSDFRVIAFA